MNEAADYERIGRLIYGLQRIGLGPEELKAMAADATQPEPAARAAHLERECARITGRQEARVSDEDIAAALEEGRRLAHGANAP